MFELSFYTILMAFLTSTVLFSLSCIFFSSSKRILNVGYKTIAFISFLSILRLVVPIDFDFTAILPMNELAKQISFFICQHRIAFFSIRLSIWDILLVIWLIGNEDGTYDIYLYGEYLETVTSLKYYDSSLPIYTRNNSN